MTLSYPFIGKNEPLNYILFSLVSVKAAQRIFQLLHEGDQPSCSEDRDLRISRFLTLPSISSSLHQHASPPSDVKCSQHSLDVYSPSALLPQVRREVLPNEEEGQDLWIQRDPTDFKLILFSILPSVTPDSTNCCGSLRGLQDKCICSASPTTAYIPLRRLPHSHIYCFCRFDACELFHGFLPFRISIVVLLLFSCFSKFLRRHRAKILGHDEDWRNLEGSKSVRVR